MKDFNLRILFLLGFCCLLSVSVTLAQKNKTDVDVESQPVETKVEIKVEEPSPPPPAETKSDSSPTYEAPATDTSNNNSSNSRDDNPPKPKPSGTIFRNEQQRNRNRELQRQEIERREREERERREREEQDRFHETCSYNTDIYGNCIYTSDDVNDTYNSQVNPLIYFNKNDIAFINYKKYIENLSSIYSPYFNDPLGLDYKPLYSVGFVEASRDLPFISPYWVFYYEPELDNFYVDFSKFNPNDFSKTGPVKFERLVLKAVGKTVKKVGKKFDYKDKVRPVIVADISTFALDRIYTFNINYLPRGNYELKLISRSGETVKLEFKLK